MSQYHNLMMSQCHNLMMKYCHNLLQFKSHKDRRRMYNFDFLYFFLAKLHFMI